MVNKRGVVGGLVATNSDGGYIENCYCMTKINGSGLTSGGFVGENYGNIVRSFSEYRGGKLLGGFCGTASKNTRYCYFFYKIKYGRKGMECLHDLENAILRDTIVTEEDIDRIGFQNSAWKYFGKDTVFKFDDENWMFTDWGKRAARREVHIHSADQLFKFARRVNSGDKEMLGAKVILENDINLWGKSWEPIGTERMNAFSGIFDGNGHSITNFKVDKDAYDNKGLFGYLRGGVFNLYVDCMARGEGTIGAIAGVNEGIIDCCGATLQFLGKGDDLRIGGLVGKNEGKIIKCYAAGAIRFVFIPILPIAIVLGAILLAGVATNRFIPAIEKANSDYNWVDEDQIQRPIDDGDRKDENQSIADAGGTVISFTFNEHVTIDLKNQQCVLDFENPSTDFNNLVVKIELDGEAEGERMLIAESGAISPGYGVKAVKLLDGMSHNLKAGEYTGLVKLVPYNKETGEKAMLDVELPVTITIE